MSAWYVRGMYMYMYDVVLYTVSLLLTGFVTSPSGRKRLLQVNADPGQEVVELMIPAIKVGLVIGRTVGGVAYIYIYTVRPR